MGCNKGDADSFGVANLTRDLQVTFNDYNRTHI